MIYNYMFFIQNQFQTGYSIITFYRGELALKRGRYDEALKFSTEYLARDSHPYAYLLRSSTLLQVCIY